MTASVRAAVATMRWTHPQDNSRVSAAAASAGLVWRQRVKRSHLQRTQRQAAKAAGATCKEERAKKRQKVRKWGVAALNAQSDAAAAGRRTAARAGAALRSAARPRAAAALPRAPRPLQWRFHGASPQRSAAHASPARVSRGSGVCMTRGASARKGKRTHQGAAGSALASAAAAMRDRSRRATEGVKARGVVLDARRPQACEAAGSAAQAAPTTISAGTPRTRGSRPASVRR